MNAAAEKFEQFEWLTHGITAKSPDFSPEPRGNSVSIDYQDRLGAIATMGTQLEKSVTSVIIYGEVNQGDYEYLRNHLAKIMLREAEQDKRKEPNGIAMYHLAWLIARKVIDFALKPELLEYYTAQGELYYAGIKPHQMTAEQYRKTWKQYENLMIIAIESAIERASDAIEQYKNKTYKDAK